MTISSQHSQTKRRSKFNPLSVTGNLKININLHRMSKISFMGKVETTNTKYLLWVDTKRVTTD